MYLWFFAFVPILLAAHLFSLRKIERKAILFANYKAMEEVFGTKILSKNYPLLMLRILTLLFLVLAVSGTLMIYEGIVTDFDFAIAVDASASMLAQDYNPNRLAAAKDAAELFVQTTPEGTKIGLLSFAGTGFVIQELTDDKDTLISAISSVDIIIAGGTAIGEAIVSSSDILLSGSKRKSIILLTDGENNIGISIEDALAYAERFSVTINTIAIGTEEGGLVGNSSFYVGVDTKTLQDIAEKTGGGFYRARTRGQMVEAFTDIATGSSQRIETDISSYFLLAALSMFIAELVLVNTKYRTIP